MLRLYCKFMYFVISVSFDESINKTFDRYLYVYVCCTAVFRLAYDRTHFFLITSPIIYVVRLMSGSCHARFLVVYDFSCPARVLLIPARFRLGVLF